MVGGNEAPQVPAAVDKVGEVGRGNPLSVLGVVDVLVTCMYVCTDKR